MDALDNPLWASLSTLHRELALSGADVLRYPRDVAPFLAVPTSDCALSAATLDELVAADETVYLVGPVPVVPAGWELSALGTILQMVCTAPIAPPPHAPAIATLGDMHRAAVRELAALVYPHYFRARTMDLGRYVGVIGEGRLDAMLGERMGYAGHREISAVCTHPARGGQGLARHLLAYATNDLLARGVAPFLHVSPDNARARQLYEQNGYAVRVAIPFTALCRQRLS